MKRGLVTWQIVGFDDAEPSITIAHPLRTDEAPPRALRLVGCEVDETPAQISVAVLCELADGVPRRSGTTRVGLRQPLGSRALVRPDVGVPYLVGEPGQTVLHRVTSDATGRDLLSVPWNLIDVTNGGRTLHIEYANPTQPDGPVDAQLDRVEVAECSDAIRIAVTIAVDQRQPVSAWHEQAAVTTVHLATPLGNRRLVNPNADVSRAG